MSNRQDDEREKSRRYEERVRDAQGLSLTRRDPGRKDGAVPLEVVTDSDACGNVLGNEEMRSKLGPTHRARTCLRCLGSRTAAIPRLP